MAEKKFGQRVNGDDAGANNWKSMYGPGNTGWYPRPETPESL